MAAGTWDAFATFLGSMFPSAIIVLLIYFLMRFFFDIPLAIARYVAETIKLAVLNSAKNDNYQAQIPTTQNANIDVPPQNADISQNNL